MNEQVRPCENPGGPGCLNRGILSEALRKASGSLYSCSLPDGIPCTQVQGQNGDDTSRNDGSIPSS